MAALTQNGALPPEVVNFLTLSCEDALSVNSRAGAIWAFVRGAETELVRSGFCGGACGLRPLSVEGGWSTPNSFHGGCGGDAGVLQVTNFRWKPIDSRRLHLETGFEEACR